MMVMMMMMVMVMMMMMMRRVFFLKAATVRPPPQRRASLTNPPAGTSAHSATLSEGNWSKDLRSFTTKTLWSHGSVSKPCTPGEHQNSW